MKSPEYEYSELPAIELFQKMGYQYIKGSQIEERSSINEVLLKDRLLSAIKRINPWMEESHITKAYNRITQINGNSLIEINQMIWEHLRADNFTLKQTLHGKENHIPVHFIDYKNIENNDFLVVNQMKYKGTGENSIPDLVVYLNGLPVAVIECKSPSSAQNAWDSAYNDLKHYQENSEKLFYYNQICCGVWETEGRYGAIKAPQKYYSAYKAAKDEDLSFLGTNPSKQDILIYNIFSKERLLDIIRHFVIFETEEGSTIKKLPRYQQLRATNKTIAKLQTGKGGVIWHTQGSGKSITMAYVTRKLQAMEFGFNNPTIIIMTDRINLDRQITKTFQNIGFKNVSHASSVAHLDILLRNDYGGIITTTLQKFQENDKEATNQTDQTEEEEHGNRKVEKKIKDDVLIKITKEKIAGKWEEISREEVVLEELSKKENLYVLVDEAHRSHYGFLASFMRTVMPKAKFVAFTGTPISKEDKSTLDEFYKGDYIDVYTIKQSVADGATVELLYDEGIAILEVKKEELDKEFEEKFGNASAEKKDKLKNEALRKYQLSKERIGEISKHIIDHFRTKIRADKHKAMIVCSGREAAIRYQETMLSLKEEGYHNFDTKVVISLGSAKVDDIAKDYYETLNWNKENPNNKKPVLLVAPEDVEKVTDDFKLPYGDEKDIEKSGNKKYDNTAILIVSDMLLTGYDAPIASCLYLDKSLKEHNLLQAIARVNRTYGSKKAGFIMDYNGITSHLVKALEIFSGDISPDDIIRNLNEEIPKLALNHQKLVDFFKTINTDRNYYPKEYIDKAIHYIDPLDLRDEFKILLKQFNKSMNIVLPNKAAMKYRNDFGLFNEIKRRASNIFVDDNELKISKDESAMLQDMINEHLKANGVENLLEEPISIYDTERFEKEVMNASDTTKELKMRNNLKHTIKVGLDKNPDFFKPLAQRLEELIKQRRENQITQLEFIVEMGKITEKVRNERKESEAKGFKTERQRAIYNSMKIIFDGTALEATKTLFDLIEGELNIVDWDSKAQVLNGIQTKIKRFLTTKMESREARIKSIEIIDILKKNKDA